MPRDYTDAWHSDAQALAGRRAALQLLEIDHPALGTPIRLVNDTDDVTSNGDDFTATAFQARLPDEPEQGLPRAVLDVDNVSRQVGDWVDQTAGGKGATFRFMEVRPDDPDTVESDITLTCRGSHWARGALHFDLGYEDVLNLAGVAVSYRPEIAPGLF